jgi:hypothetical protein
LQDYNSPVVVDFPAISNRAPLNSLLAKKNPSKYVCLAAPIWEPGTHPWTGHLQFHNVVDLSVLVFSSRNALRLVLKVYLHRPAIPHIDGNFTMKRTSGPHDPKPAYLQRL